MSPQLPSQDLPGPSRPAPGKKGILPWVLAGACLVAFALIAGVLMGVPGTSGSGGAGSSGGGDVRSLSSATAKPFGSGSTLIFGSRSKVPMVDSTTAMASFKYPEEWVQTGKNIIVIEHDGKVPAENFVARNRALDSTALLSYTASAKPSHTPTQQRIHEVLDSGFQGQLDLPPERLLDLRRTSGFGCVKDFNYVERPAVVERDHLYGFSYGYTCMTLEGPIEGEYLAAADDTGTVHRLTVEALQFEWDRNRDSLTAIIDSFKPRM